MAADHLSAMLDLLRRHGPTPAQEVLGALGISQPTLSRLARTAAPGVVRIGRARATRYAATREVGALGHAWPVYRIDGDGRSHLAAHLHALAPRAWWYDAAAPKPAWLHGEFADGLFPDLPWFVDDLRPQGFMGRAFARHYGDALGLGVDPQRWSADGVLAALLRYGDDLPGDFVLGDAALERVQRAALRPPDCIGVAQRLPRYAGLAEAALAGHLPGSSAGGEQPKFAACVDEGGGTYRHLLVKFSPPRDTAVGRRWADLLACEHLVSETIREHGLPACDTTWSESGGRCFLEVRRFDRVHTHGRRGFVSLLALDSAYYGRLDSWTAAADRLQRDGWLTPADADVLRVSWWLGGLIANSDMHFGNVSLALNHARPLGLAPAYDMLPMHYRPSATGEVVMHAFEPPLPTPSQRPLWRRAAEIAVVFWQRVGMDSRVSNEFRAESARVLTAIARQRDYVG